jgi:hypothetical protein
MTGEVDKEKIVFFIKNYYEKNRETPSMKIISKECGINSRVFYELFNSQKEAFEVAGVPYSDEKRKKVEPANVARRTPPAIQVLSKKTVYLVNRNRLDEYRSRNISDPFDEIRLKVANIKNSILQSNPQDEIDIEIAYTAARSYVDAVSFDFIQLSYEYQMCKTLKNTPASREKVFFVEKGFDFDDIDGSCQKLKEKIVTEKRLYYEPKFNWKASYYYSKLLGP